MLTFSFVFRITQMPRYHYEGYFPGPTVNQNRRPNPNTGNYRKDVGKPNNKPNQRYNSYAPNASKQSMNKSGPKHYQNGGHSYDSTPVKDPNGKPHYESANNSNNNHAASGNNLAKRDTVYVTPDASNTMPPPPTHSPYLSPYMSYVQYDGNAEQHPPMYMPMSMFPSPGKHDHNPKRINKTLRFSLFRFRPFNHRFRTNAVATAASSRSNASCISMRTRWCRTIPSFASARL